MEGREVEIISSKCHKNMKIEKLYDIFCEGNYLGIKRTRTKSEKTQVQLLVKRFVFKFLHMCI